MVREEVLARPAVGREEVLAHPTVVREGNLAVPGTWRVRRETALARDRGGTWAARKLGQEGLPAHQR